MRPNYYEGQMRYDMMAMGGNRGIISSTGSVRPVTKPVIQISPLKEEKGDKDKPDKPTFISINLKKEDDKKEERENLKRPKPDL